MIDNWLKPYLEEFILNTGLPKNDSEELFNDFSMFFSGMLISLEESLANKDFLSISNFAHQLKGASGSLLIEPVFNLALSVENASKIYDENECAFQIELLKKIDV